MKVLRCPICGQVGSCNKFGDITDRNMDHNHPFLSAIQSRVCRKMSPVPALKLELLSTAQLSKMKVKLNDDY